MTGIKIAFGSIRVLTFTNFLSQMKTARFGKLTWRKKIMIQLLTTVRKETVSISRR
jgi:hypothetical protein